MSPSCGSTSQLSSLTVKRTSVPQFLYRLQTYTSAHKIMADEKVLPHAEVAPRKITVDGRNADVTLRLLEDHGHKFGPLTPEKEQQLRRTIYRRLMTLLSAINIVLFVRVPTKVITRLQLTGIRLTSQHLATLPFWGYSKRPRSLKRSITI